MRDNSEEQWEEIIDRNWQDLLNIEDAVLPRFRYWHDVTEAEIIAVQSLIMNINSGPTEFSSTAYRGLVLTVADGPTDIKKMADLGSAATNNLMIEHLNKMHTFFTTRSDEELEDIARIFEEYNNEALDMPTDPGGAAFGALIKNSSRFRLLSALQGHMNTYDMYTQSEQAIPWYLWLRINSLIYTLLEDLGYPADEYTPGYYDQGE